LTIIDAIDREESRKEENLCQPNSDWWSVDHQSSQRLPPSKQYHC